MTSANIQQLIGNFRAKRYEDCIRRCVLGNVRHRHNAVGAHTRQHILRVQTRKTGRLRPTAHHRPVGRGQKLRDCNHQSVWFLSVQTKRRRARGGQIQQHSYHRIYVPRQPSHQPRRRENHGSGVARSCKSSSRQMRIPNHRLLRLSQSRYRTCPL